MPVGTQATVKGLTQRDLAEDLGVKILLANTYHLYLRPGHEPIRRMGGLHRFMSWPNAILTDSGGFQVFSLSGLRKIAEEGVVFRSHLNGDLHTFTPESTVDVQLALGSDILMALDECPEYPVSREYAIESMRRTLRWAGQAMAHYRDRTAADPLRHALFPIVQGSMFADLRRECARELVDLEAPGYAMGGLSVGEPRDAEPGDGGSHRGDPAAGQAALRHGRGDAGRIGGLRGARGGHDGLRAALAQCPQRVPVHLPGARDHQARAL